MRARQPSLTLGSLGGNFLGEVMNDEERSVQLHQHRIYAREYSGEEPTIILMHGFPDNVHHYFCRFLTEPVAVTDRKVSDVPPDHPIAQGAGTTGFVVNPTDPSTPLKGLRNR